ncbi:ABC transporter substrate-binding protein [Arsenicitalea aurantiaca]|uniref:ABC transporter substrate-binding protein n=1 Tax=Arsenicitalea aurantiaca TaxID=1783274 RepID=A0A433XBA7_9HYPH|nr:ABC transporter substrate-binding protein [Arsenicitalea aurantiaca]RUT31381.1 ABC transporter substrate-binding protein [Arsenicitalea aurantiaca]
MTLTLPARGILSALTGLALLTTAVSAEPFRMIVTDLEAPLVPNSVMDLALNLGYFEAEGVEVELVRVQQTPSALAALQADEGEMANIAVDALLQLVAAGNSDLRAVVSPNKSLPFLIAGKDEIATAADLGGHSFGVGRVGSLDHSLSMKVLAEQGVDTDTLEVVTLGQPNVRAQALAAGQIDATTISIGVWMSLPDPEGLHVLVSQDDYYEAAPVVNKVNIVTSETLENRREDVEGVVRALVRISRDFAADPEKWVEGMATARPDVPREDLEALAEAFTQSWSVNGGLSREELEYTADWIYEGEDFQNVTRVETAEWVDFSVLDTILAELGTDEAMDAPTR